MGSDLPRAEAAAPSDDRLIFMTDASAEAERLMTALRNRGYTVVEVPLALLLGRVAVQRPALILCDVDAAPALDVVRRLRDVPGGGRVDVVFFGEPSRSLDEMRDEVFHESSGFFVRPVDTFGLLRKVEALIGPPSSPDPARAMGSPSSRPPPALSRAGADAGKPPPAVPTPVPPSAPSLDASAAARVASTTPPRAPPRPSPVPDSGPSSLPPRASSVPAPEVVLPQPIPLGFGVEGEPPGHGRIPQSEISAELEGILARAEQRVGSGGGSVRLPASKRMTPEAEVDAVLPPEVLSALDEPLDIDEEDVDEGGGTGTGGGSSTGGGKTGMLTGVGSAAGAGARTGVGTAVGVLGAAAPASEPRGAAGPTAPPPRRDSLTSGPEVRAEDAIERTPDTPPAVPIRPPEPPSWSPASLSAAGPRTSVEPRPMSARDPDAHTAVLRPTPAPPAPPAPGIPLGPATPVAMPEPAAPPAPPAPPRPAALEIPQVLGKGDSAVGLARAIRSRFTGAVAFETDAGIRRVVLRDGDFVTAASGIASESLVAFLTERGTLSPDVQKALGHKLPPFGRHAGAALIAHGHLRQDELWPVLRAHAEWLVGRVLGMTSGAAGLEVEVPARLQAEPAVFGGATGAEVYVEIVRRVVSPEEALARLGGERARLVDGPNPSLLSECALTPEESALVARSKAATVGDVLSTSARPDLPAVLYALVQLGVLEALAPAPAPPARAAAPRTYDALDEQALRARILARKALVEEGDYFALLGVPRSATSYDVQRAYTELRREFEPSRILTPSTASLRGEVDLILEVLDEAYEILSDPVRRERYRRALEATPGHAR